jgi:hypothetical protein
MSDDCLPYNLTKGAIELVDWRRREFDRTDYAHRVDATAAACRNAVRHGSSGTLRLGGIVIATLNPVDRVFYTVEQSDLPRVVPRCVLD